tara:strand:- start:306 stop:1598 length:1293 start_codon:yes stop_codon:yes gene_type:complete
VVKINSWNNYPKVTHNSVESIDKLEKLNFENYNNLAHGLGRSYGDVCLNENGQIILTRSLNQILNMDTEKGSIKIQGGVSIKEILEKISPNGWFLPVVPGTKYVTIGGAIANDIHGKNHHKFGSFGNYVENLQLLRSNGDIINCSINENPDYFRATIGGMGLTGIIISAEIRLQRIESQYIESQTVRYNSLSEYWDINQEFEKKFDYTVSWVDCQTDNKAGLRGIFHSGNHAKKQLRNEDKKEISIPLPFRPPISVVNNFSKKIINQTYFALNKKENEKYQHYKSFFFPLDLIKNWGKAYGPKGFFQYQFVIPLDNGIEGIKNILKEINAYGRIPALGVLKTFGGIESLGMMSFPRRGITMALDFENKGQKTLDFFNRLDDIVLEQGGALYPGKDSRMSKKMFDSSFPNINEFKKYIDPNFSSSLWRRVN